LGSSGSLDQRIQGLYNQVASGTLLTNEQVDDLVSAAASAVAPWVAAADDTADQYQGIMRRSNANVDDVVTWRTSKALAKRLEEINKTNKSPGRITVTLGPGQAPASPARGDTDADTDVIDFTRPENR
jgi:hypothetical protein